MAAGGTLTFEPEPEEEALLPETPARGVHVRKVVGEVDEDELLQAPPAEA
jgi:hypothetical protein